MAGRGAGKSRAGAEWVIDNVKSGRARRPILAGQTAADVRDIMVQTILDVSPRWFRPKYFPSRRALVWSNGASALLLSAEDPEQARGPNADLIWADELGAWSRSWETWQNLSLAHRKGTTRAMVTTTPRRTEALLQILAQPTTVVSRSSSLENRRHLSEEFTSQILSLYSGARFAKQEIEGQLVDQLEGAWFNAFEENTHVSESAVYDPGKPVVLGVDAGTSRTTAAVYLQTEQVDRNRLRFTVFGDYLAIDRYSRENAEAIQAQLAELCPGAMQQVVWIDPASSARTSIGLSALAEHRAVFGERIVNQSPPGTITDGLDLITGLLERQDLVINPACKGLIDGFRNYAREERSGQYLDIPKANQSPWEDPIDALRYAVRGHWPEGRRTPPSFRRIHPRSIF
jgi:hypothetical protein